MQLNYTEKGVRKMAELLKTYRMALADDQVLDCFKVSVHHFLAVYGTAQWALLDTTLGRPVIIIVVWTAAPLQCGSSKKACQLIICQSEQACMSRSVTPSFAAGCHCQGQEAAQADAGLQSRDGGL